MSALRYPYGPRVPEAGRTIELLPGVHWLRMPLPSSLRHINLWALRDDEGWTLIDTGIWSAQLQLLWEDVLGGALRGTPVQRIVATHMHSDHLGLSDWLCERHGVELWMSAGDYAFAQRLRAARPEGVGTAAAAFLKAHGVVDENLLARTYEEPTPYPKLVPSLPAQFHPIADGDILHVGVHGWRAIVGHGHTPEHLSYYCAARGVLIAGDMLLPRISTHVGINALTVDADPLGAFLASVDRLAELPPDTLVLPSHGEPFRGLRERAAELRTHHEQRLEQARGACTTPCSAADLLPVLFPRVSEPRQLMLAHGETLAHLVWLAERGALTREVDAGVTRFVH